MHHQQLAEAEILVARSRLVDRLALLERKVVGATSDAAESVRQASANVGSMIQETTTGVSAAVNSVTSNVCETLDLARQVRSYPWQSLGLAAAAGILVGLMPGRTRSNTATAAQPGLGSALWDSLRKELTGVGESLIASGAARVKQSLTNSMIADEEVVRGSERPTMNDVYQNGIGSNGRRF